MANNEGGEKTEKATSKKRREARENGQVLRSQEVNTAVILLVMFGSLQLFGGEIIKTMARVVIIFFDPQMMGSLTAADVAPIFLTLVYEFLLAILPICLIALVVGVAVNFLQVGFLFTTKPLRPKLSKLNPISGFKNMFSLNALVELVKSAAKVAILGFIVYGEYVRNMQLFPKMMVTDILSSAEKILEMIFGLAFQVCAAFAVLAAADYLYQRWKYEKDLMMSKQEVKDEWKLSEGNPEIKGRIKQKQREMSMMRMMQDVPHADVVITNPTQYAIALKYDDTGPNAPKVVAKGKDFVAARIKEIAMEAGVEIVENKPVAQALYVYCDVGDEIPADMYQAIAEILAYVFRLRNNNAKRRATV